MGKGKAFVSLPDLLNRSSMEEVQLRLIYFEARQKQTSHSGPATTAADRLTWFPHWYHVH